MNPFRDRAPEDLAERHLGQLRMGQVESISAYIGENKDILLREREYPIQSWCLGDRKDTTATSELVYWVKRGNGYSKDGQEEEALLEVIRYEEGWKLKTFSAIY